MTELYVDAGMKPPWLCCVIGDDVYFMRHTEPSVNRAEYAAVRWALDLAEDQGIKPPLTIYSDSKLVVEQINRRYQIRNPALKQLNQYVRQAAPEGTIFRWLPREQNKAGIELERLQKAGRKR